MYYTFLGGGRRSACNRKIEKKSVAGTRVHVYIFFTILQQIISYFRSTRRTLQYIFTHPLTQHRSKTSIKKYIV